MATMPGEWLVRLARLCLGAGVAHDDAETCACDILLRYHHRRSVYPWDEPSTTFVGYRAGLRGTIRFTVRD